MSVVDTSWTMIEAAAAGGAVERDLFVRRYGPVVDAYLKSRWRAGPHLADRDDALQDVFLECLRAGGALERVERRRDGGFRAFLFGVTRNVAARIEGARAKRPKGEIPSASNAPGVPVAGPDPDAVFDRAWALATVREALLCQSRRAELGDESMKRRVRILEARFRDGVPLRVIAERSGEDPARVHKDYAQARLEFERALREVVAFDVGRESDRVTRECRDILRLLQSGA